MGYRWLPKQGKPTTHSERVMQNIIRVIAFLPVYTAIIATLTLLVIIFGIPFINGR